MHIKIYWPKSQIQYIGAKNYYVIIYPSAKYLETFAKILHILTTKNKYIELYKTKSEYTFLIVNILKHNKYIFYIATCQIKLTVINRVLISILAQFGAPSQYFFCVIFANYVHFPH